MTLRLGIDTGGTYTDAVLVDAANTIVVAVKSLTTRHDLTLGIGAALAQIPSQHLAQIELVSLSTTLTTNAVVEGNGAPVCVLLAGLSEQQIERSGLHAIVEAEHIIRLAGGHNAGGNPLQPLDEATATEAILANQDKVSAFAISAQFGVRNPAHELRLQQMVQDLTGMPVTCGHELATSLGAPRRALTASLNARMIPFIQDLMAAVEAILAKLKIKAPLMIVKGDGSIVNSSTALLHPVTTILSGPAASVIGACAMSGQADAIIADMGGTTTDIAIVTQGQPELASEGARVGDWQPMVETVKVYSIGLGGDSEVRFDKGNIKLGPRRVVPLSLLCHQYPHLIERLQSHLQSSPSPRHNRFATRLENNPALLRQLNEDEHQAWELLAQGPVELETLVFERPHLAKAVARLVRKGMAIYSGFTPSDAAHVLGKSEHWNNEGAHLAARIWARQMRHLYGYGQWVTQSATEAAERIFTIMETAIIHTLLQAGLHQHNLLNEQRSHHLADLLGKLITQQDQSGTTQSLFGVHFGQQHQLVAVGAPAATYYPKVAEQLGMTLCLPPYGHVANALGAVMGQVVQRAEVVITQPSEGIFRIFSQPDVIDCSDLTQALQQAEALAEAQATALALNAGTDAVKVVIRHDHKHVKSELDGELFVEAKITAVASGQPNIYTWSNKSNTDSDPDAHSNGQMTAKTV